MKESINVSGKRLNKLEEIVKLLQKLNEDLYDEESREKEGYPIEIYLKANGSGEVGDCVALNLYNFGNLSDLEFFLKADSRNRITLAQESALGRTKGHTKGE